MEYLDSSFMVIIQTMWIMERKKGRVLPQPNYSPSLELFVLPVTCYLGHHTGKFEKKTLSIQFIDPLHLQN